MFNIEFLFNQNILKREGLPFLIIGMSFLLLIIITICITYKIIKKKDGKNEKKK